MQANGIARGRQHTELVQFNIDTKLYGHDTFELWRFFGQL
jgi:hypothetical protein